MHLSGLMQQTKHLQLWKEVAEHMHKIILIILHMFSATSWTLNLRLKIECSIATSFTKTARVNTGVRIFRLGLGSIQI